MTLPSGQDPTQREFRAHVVTGEQEGGGDTTPLTCTVIINAAASVYRRDRYSVTFPAV